MAWIYPDVINKLNEECNSFLKNEISIEQIQFSIYDAANKILALEERWLRQMLLNSESQIELNIYTIESDKLFPSIELIVKNILSRIK